MTNTKNALFAVGVVFAILVFCWLMKPWADFALDTFGRGSFLSVAALLAPIMFVIVAVAAVLDFVGRR